MQPSASGEHVVVETKAGTVRGLRRMHSAPFLGIPFAEPRTVIFGSRRLCRRSHGAAFEMHFDMGRRRNARRWQR
jgi:carboxylesterase type B